MKRFRDTDYFVTEDGRVYSNKFNKWRELKLQKNKDSYLTIGLNKNRYLVHRLVAECYLTNPDNLPEVDHRDDDKTNNHISNLEWVTRVENMKRAGESGLMSRKPKLTEEQVKWIKKHYIPFHREFGTRVLSRKFNVSIGCIDGIVNNRNWKHL